MPERLQVTGLRELEAAMRGLVPTMQKRALRTALRAGAGVIRTAARGAAPVKTGALKRNTSLVIGKINPAKGQVSAYVGVETGKVQTPNAEGKVAYKRKGKLRLRSQTRREKRSEDPYYYRFQELGFTAVGRRKALSGAQKRRGVVAVGTKVPGKRFLTNALANNTSAVIEKFRASLAGFIDKYRPK